MRLRAAIHVSILSCVCRLLSKANFSSARRRLAAAGATTYVFDRVTGRVVEHIEGNLTSNALIGTMLRAQPLPATSTACDMTVTKRRHVGARAEWDVEPRKVLKQLLSPAKRPSDNSSAVERFMWSVSKGMTFRNVSALQLPTARDSLLLCALS